MNLIKKNITSILKIYLTNWSNQIAMVKTIIIIFYLSQKLHKHVKD